MTTVPKEFAIRVGGRPVQVVWLPTDPPRPAPPLLTGDEAILLLRVDKARSKNPKRTLRYLRKERGLRGVPIAGTVMYRLESVMEFIEASEAGKAGGKS